MKAKLLRLLGLGAYFGGLCVLLGLSAYTAFSIFVRSGVTRTPDLAGLSREAAESQLSDRGLSLGAVPEEGRYSEEVPAGLVVQQDPKSGTLVKRGAPVSFYLSLGPQRVEMPDLAGQALPSAQVALAAAGLPLGRTVTVYSRRESPGMVVQQSPEPDTTVAPTTPVDLLISSPGSGERFLMPDLIYRDYERVRLFFGQRGFRLGSVRLEPYEGIPEGVILRQFPLAGHPVSRRDAISLVVASGDRPPR